MTAPVSFPPDRATYLRANAWLAAFAMAAATVVLWLIGNPYLWTGPFAGLAAIAIRAWYMASEELAALWRIEDGRLTGPGGRIVALAEIETVRSMGPMVQVIAKGGAKHLIKYQADPAATIAAINAARGRA